MAVTKQMAPSLSTSLKLPRLPHLPHLPSLPGRPGSRSGEGLVGLDIQPGFVAAVKARVNGSVLAERAAARPLDADTVREGEVVDVEALTESLRELFSDGALGKRVRVGIANQRTVMRTLELPPVTDRKELAAAVRFQAQDQVPMPLSNAVIDFHPLGIVDTPAGSRQRVVLVAAQRDMVERLLGAVRGAGLTPEGVDLSAFALIRSLHDRSDDETGRVLYLNVDGLTNLAIAEGTICRFTRVVGGGVEAMAAELASRREISLTDARALLASVDLSVPLLPSPSSAQADVASSAGHDPNAGGHDPNDQAAASTDGALAPEQSAEGEPESSVSREQHEVQERSMGYAETISAAQGAPRDASEQAPVSQEPADADVRSVLENGVRELVGEIRNSLDFHRTQEQGGDVSHVALSGAVLDLPGFPEALQTSLGMEVRKQDVGLVDTALEGKVSTHRLSIAAGLATAEAPR
jgi:type IV pilus assembly protein PilM